MKPQVIFEKIQYDYNSYFQKNHFAPKFITMNTKTCEDLVNHISSITGTEFNPKKTFYIFAIKILKTEDLEINEFIIH